MKITLQLFGAFKQFSNEIEMNLPEKSNIESLRQILMTTLEKINCEKKINPTININTLIKSSRFATDTEILAEDTVLLNPAILSILPPVSGG